MVKSKLISAVLLNIIIGSLAFEDNNITSVNLKLLPRNDPSITQDAALLAHQLIKKYGYPSEVHHVTTEDGYVLEMHRIPKPGGQPVLLMHGLLDSSSTWVMMGPSKGLGYMLADLGYDVWMGNARGNRYSRRNIKLNPTQSKFWQFSFHEIGKYDVKSIIDCILNETKYEKIHYVGHSQGTVVFWIFCNEHPEYTKKIISMNALAPVAYIKHGRSPVVNLITFFLNKFSTLARWLGPNEFLPNSEFLALVSAVFCKDEAITQEICANIIFLITGYNDKQMNKTMLPVMIGHTPAGAATKQIIHFSQLSNSGKFRQYDYGAIRNLIEYRSISPPKYDLSKVNVKVALHYSTNDWLAHPSDVEQLHQELPKPIGKFLVDDHDFNHLDFVWGIDARPFLYERVVKLMKLVENGEL